MNRSFYARLDSSKEAVMHDLKPEDAKRYNKLNYGIFWTVNEFSGARTKDNLKKINSWYIDLDGNKESIIEKLNEGLYPSYVVETKNGFHAYFYALDAKPENYKEVQERLIDFYDADANAKDVTRVLRVPGFYHWKDPKNPYLVQTVWHKEHYYSEKDMLFFYPSSDDEDYIESQKSNIKRVISFETDEFWDKVYELNAIDALERLSGKMCVNGEVFSFKKNSNGKHNIIVNGKGTSCFVDQQGAIGSSAKGGPSIWQWLRYYGHSHKQTYQILKDNFKELWK